MYTCADCNVQFDEPEMVIEPHYELTPTEYETSYACPCCGSSEYYESVECEYCNEDIRLELKSLYIKFKNGDIICNDCLHEYCQDKFT